MNKLVEQVSCSAWKRYSSILIFKRYTVSKPLPKDPNMPVEMEDPFKPLPKRCNLCGVRIDYKNVQLLSQYVSGYTGMIYGIHDLGLCEKKYEEIVDMIEHSRMSGYMPTVHKDPAFMFDISNVNQTHQFVHDKSKEYGSNLTDEREPEDSQ